ncbi:hypothetical protein D3C71_1816550 [compost metagenome]
MRLPSLSLISATMPRSVTAEARNRIVLPSATALSRVAPTSSTLKYTTAPVVAGAYSGPCASAPLAPSRPGSNGKYAIVLSCTCTVRPNAMPKTLL